MINGGKGPRTAGGGSIGKGGSGIIMQGGGICKTGGTDGCGSDDY